MPHKLFELFMTSELMEGVRRALEVHLKAAMQRRRVVGSLLFVGMLLLSTPSFAQVRALITIAPPELPVYEQPLCPGDGYIWTPGYWGWDGDYYWIPDAWVLPPEVGFLWTPGYWGWGGEGFLFNEGYWGSSIGFYGGIDYGFGYFGQGYDGGRWENGHFFYNTALNRVDANAIHNVYNTRVNETVNRVSYNGGNGGINARATPEEETAARGRHIGPVAAQTQGALSARNNPQQRFSANRGAPPVTASTRSNAVAVHPKDLPPIEHPAAPNSGNAKQDQKYQKQQENLIAKQNQERQKLQRTQDTEHRQLAKQNAAPERMQQVEQQHQQQTQRMQQGHTQEMQQMQERQSSGGGGSRGGGRR
jgi:hypothetical protein